MAAETSTASGQQSNQEHNGGHVERRAWTTLQSTKLASQVQCEKLRESPSGTPVGGHLSLTVPMFDGTKAPRHELEMNMDAATESLETWSL